MNTPEWRIASGGGETKISPEGPTEAAGSGWAGLFERTSFGPGFHMHLGRIDVTADAEHRVTGADEGPTMVSVFSVVHGRCVLRMADWPPLALAPGRAILFVPRERRGVFELPAPQTFRFFSVAMAPGLLASLLEGQTPAALVPLMESQGRATVVRERAVSAPTRALIAELGEPGQAGPLQRLQREAVAIRLLTEIVGAELAGAAESPPLTAGEAAALREMRAQLLADLREAPSAAELAQAAGMGLRRFVRAFEALHGASPAQLLRQERLSEARRLLEAGDLPLKEIAWRVGYSHLSNFVTAFANEFGMPPRRYQRRALAAQ